MAKRTEQANSPLFRQHSDDGQIEIGVQGVERVLAPHVEVADTFLLRAAGLQFRLPLRRGHGLLLYPAASIHTMWLRAPIDVIWLDGDGKILKTAPRIRPWTFRLAPKNTFAVLELGAGSLQAFSEQSQTELSVGRTLEYRPPYESTS